MNTEQEQQELKELRKQIFITGYRGGMAHLASSFSCLEMLYTFYIKKLLHFNPENAKWQDRDRFILSKGHAGLALYAILRQAGMVSDEQFQSYMTEHSSIAGEPCMRDCEWIEATTGSLGHGLSMGLGMAMALKMNRSKAKVYVLLGDGELEEGTVWEAIMTAPYFGLDNLVAIVDNNRIQKMDFVENTIGNPQWESKWRSFGWEVATCNGHDIEDVQKALCRGALIRKPYVVIANTVKGKGVSLMENNPNWHFKLPNKRELKVFQEELGIATDELCEKI